VSFGGSHCHWGNVSGDRSGVSEGLYRVASGWTHYADPPPKWGNGLLVESAEGIILRSFFMLSTR